jgi:hypothetical protein
MLALSAPLPEFGQRRGWLDLVCGGGRHQEALINKF